MTTTSRIVHPKPDKFNRCWCKAVVLRRGKPKVVDGKIHYKRHVCVAVREN